MRVIEPGHTYLVDRYDDENSRLTDQITFMKRVGDKYPGNIPPTHGGTNLQELYRVAINRLQYLDDQVHHPFNYLCIMFSRFCIWLLEMRAAERHNRQLHQMYTARQIEIYMACKTCGHLHTGEQGCGTKFHGNSSTIIPRTE